MVSPAFLALSLVLAVLVAAFVLRPLWRDSRGAALGLGAGLLACTAALYLLVGTPTALDPRTTRAPETIGDAIAELEAALAREPQLAEGWVLLGRAYRADGRAAEARDAFGRAARLLPDEADVQVEAAEARALAAPGRRIDDEALAMLARALGLQPRHQRARWFLGIARRQRGEAAEAAALWESLLADVDARTAASLRPQIDAARAEAGLPPLPPPAAGGNGESVEAAAIRVRVTVAPELAARIPDGATLYVLALPLDGPRMPVAVERLPAAGFPREVVLDDGDGPMPTARLSQAGRVAVEARVSMSGDAAPQAGDLRSPAREAQAGEALELVIDRVVE
jgi:cytochrome c-type biogenesis protein CcmH